MATKKATASNLRPVQHRVLNAIVKSDGALSRRKIMEEVFGGNSVNLKPILGVLLKGKLVTAVELEIDGKTEEAFSATAAGKKESAKPLPERASHTPLPKPGGSFVREYKGKKITVKVTDEGFQIGSHKFSSLTAAAQHVRGSDMAVNGWRFFGFVKGTENGEKTE